LAVVGDILNLHWPTLLRLANKQCIQESRLYDPNLYVLTDVLTARLRIEYIDDCSAQVSKSQHQK